MLKQVFEYLGLDEAAIQPAVRSGVHSVLFTAPGVIAGFLLAAISGGATPDPTTHVPPGMMGWMEHNWQPFFVAQVVAPALRFVVAANRFSMPPAAPGTPDATKVIYTTEVH